MSTDDTTADAPGDDTGPAVYYDPAQGALFVGGLKTTDKAILREAARWSTGERGEPVADMADLAGTDLTSFAREALSIGSRVLAIAAQDGDTRAVRQAVKEASDQVGDIVTRASASSEDAVRRAVETMTQATRQAHETVMTEVNRLVGGENPELAERLRPILAGVGTDLKNQAAEAMAAAHESQRAEAAERHQQVLGVIGDLRREFAVRVGTDDATAAVKGVTTIKGFDYESQINDVLIALAADIGEEYEATGERAGRLPRNKKGDGVLHVSGGIARVVVECHDGTSKDWGPYLAEAERNRGAQASVGLIRYADDNAGRVVRVVAPKRLVVAFDPDTDDPELLRTIMLLMRTVALTASGRFGTEEVATANEHIREALSIIEDLDEAKRSASAIAGHATKIEQIVTRTMTAIQRELNGAQNALTGAATAAAQSSADEPQALSA